MARFNMEGDVGVFVKTNPYEERRKAYYEYGLNKVLGDFVGSVQQNTATYNKIKTIQTTAPSPLAPSPLNPTQTNPLASAINYKQPSTPSPYIAYQSPFSQPLTPKAPPSSNPIGQSNAYVEAINNPSLGATSGGAAVPGKTPTNTGGGLNTGGIAPKVPAQAPAVNPEAAPSASLSLDELVKRSGVPLSEFESKGIQLTESQKGEYDERMAELKTIEEATGGTTSAFDINAAIDNNPEVIMAREKADRTKAQADSALQRALDALALDEQYDIISAKEKAMELKNQLLANLERRGLALSGFRTGGESSIASGEEAAINKVKTVTTLKSMNEEAQALAKKENIDLGLAEVIVRAANTEYKRMQDEAKARQNAIDDFLKSQGLIVNPVTGEILTTASERRAIEAAQRAEERFQMSQDAAARADAQFQMTQARFDAFLKNQAEQDNPQISDVITSKQEFALQAAGIAKPVYGAILFNLTGGVPLNGEGGVREEMVSKYGWTEANRILDTFDKVVNISSIESGSIFQKASVDDVIMNQLNSWARVVPPTGTTQ